MKVRFIKNKKYTPWEVAVPQSVTGRKRVRKYFPSQEEAAAYIVRVRQKGFDNADDRLLAHEGAPTLKECSAMWLSRHQNNSRASRAQLKMVLRRLDQKFGSKKIDAISHRELEPWINQISGGPVNRRNHWRVARQFFEWVHDWLEAIPRNPMKKVAKPQGERNEVQILSPDQLEGVLKKTLEMEEEERWPLIMFFALGAFSGLRTIEILRAEWGDIGDSEIHVKSKKTRRGLRARYVEILPALECVLKTAPKGEGKIIPWAEKAFREHRSKVVKALEWKEWPDNCLRHSFRTYHVAHFQSIEKTRVQMGHTSDDMTVYQYGLASARTTAEAWFNIRLDALLCAVLKESNALRKSQGAKARHEGNQPRAVRKRPAVSAL